MENRKLSDKFSRIKLLLLDVDGVLTDGRIIYDDTGSEIKVFHVKDGLGIRLLMHSGIQVGIATSRYSTALRHRCDDLGISLILDGLATKSEVPSTVYRQIGISAEETAYVGDDLMDIPLMKQVGVAIAVADAHELVRRHADMITRSPGGNGAVREICETILKAKNLWEHAISRFL